MTTLTLASAQTCAIAGDLSGNIQRHLAFMVAAAEQGCNCWCLRNCP